MSAVVRDQLFRNSESSDNVVKEKEGCGSCRVVKCWHSLGPFCEIVDRHNDIFMVTNGWRATLHKVDGPFTKGTSCDNRMEGSWGSLRLRGEMLAIGTVFDCLNAITEEGRPKIPSAHDFLGSRKTGEMATASATMAGIEDLFNFSMPETTTKDSIYTATIKVVTDKKVARSLVSDTSSSVTIKVKSELLGSQVSEDITVPRIVRSNGE